MAVIFADPGGEFYFGLGVLGAGIWNAENGVSLVNSAPSGRQAASDGKFYGFQFNAGSNQTLTKIFAPNYSHLIVGWAFYLSATAWTNNSVIVAFQDAGTNQCDLRTNASGQVFFTRNGTVIGSASTVPLTAGWNYLEVEIVFATAATGSVQCWLNGVSITSTSSVQTTTSGNAYANRLIFEGSNSGGVDYMKDVYVLDATTGANTTHLGDVTVGVKYPNAAGVNQQWTPNASTQVSRVQDGITHTGTWPDGDTTYISDGTAGDISDFAHETLTLTGTLYSVLHISYVRKDDAGARAFRQVCLSGATTETNGADISATNTYLYYFDILDQDPNTSAQWTVANYNAATFGAKEIT
jgi:hypothetical protein